MKKLGFALLALTASTFPADATNTDQHEHVASDLPSTFLGTWASSQVACKDTDKKRQIAIGPKTIWHYDWHQHLIVYSKPTYLQMPDGAPVLTITALVSANGEGESWVEKIRLSVAKDQIYYSELENMALFQIDSPVTSKENPWGEAFVRCPS